MKVVGIGGGHGLAATLRALRLYADDVCAVVTVADDGGSSGRLTRDLGIPPPGDIRNCLVALAEHDDLAAAFEHRFGAGPLTGHSLGNLIIAALTEQFGDFAAAVSRAGELLRARGRVYPATTSIVSLRALVRDGVVQGQVAVAQAEQPIQAVYLEPADPPALEPACAAIAAADQIVMGPGSLFTSLIATLLVPGVGAALRDSRGQKIYVCNARMQKGETQGFDAAAHVEALVAHAGADAVDVAIVQSPVVQPDGVRIDPRSFDLLGVKLVEADLADPSAVHDPHRLALVLGSLAG